MKRHKMVDITDLIGSIPYRMAFAGGWIDQPFISKHNPSPPGSMVVVALEPNGWFMTRSGMGTSTRRVALDLWGGSLPEDKPETLVRELYTAENTGKSAPSGSQDMAGIIYPGVNRLDYDYNYEGGLFPIHVESNNSPEVAHWLEGVIHMVPISQRPPGYDPLSVKKLDPGWISRLSQSGKDCYAAIVSMDAQSLGASMNECMLCWEAILPNTVSHPSIKIDLKEILENFQARYHGAMYSGCGGGYVYVVSEEPVPGSLQVKVRIAEQN
jgi:hypothetical protein